MSRALAYLTLLFPTVVLAEQGVVSRIINGEPLEPGFIGGFLGGLAVVLLVSYGCHALNFCESRKTAHLRTQEASLTIVFVLVVAMTFESDTGAAGILGFWAIWGIQALIYVACAQDKRG